MRGGARESEPARPVTRRERFHVRAQDDEGDAAERTGHGSARAGGRADSTAVRDDGGPLPTPGGRPGVPEPADRGRARDGAPPDGRGRQVDYMDYVDDDAMFMLTLGQTERMHAALEGLRKSLLK
jgi:hypothetical protein